MSVGLQSSSLIPSTASDSLKSAGDIPNDLKVKDVVHDESIPPPSKEKETREPSTSQRASSKDISDQVETRPSSSGNAAKASLSYERQGSNIQTPSSSTSDPTAQLLSEAARVAAITKPPNITGIKRDHDTANQDRPETNQTKRRKDESRPPMRIDTNIQYTRPSLHGSVETIVPLTAATPERMTTRVSSGAIRHKSVSEILGATPRSSHSDHTPEIKDASNQTPKTVAPAGSPHSAMFQSKLGELRDKEKDRSKMSTVVFPRQNPMNNRPLEPKSEEIRSRDKPWEQKDYLVPLFHAQASAQNPKLNQLVVSSKKTLSSNDHRLEYREDQDCRILKRIYHLQNNNRWSLRQLERSKEPERPVSHWDAVIAEAKWMRTDFREERRWMIAAAKNLADWCLEYVNGDKDERRRLRVKLRKQGSHVSAANRTTPMSLSNISNLPSSDPTPELIPSTVDDISDSADEEITMDILQTIAPAALFSLPSSDVLFGVEFTSAADKMLEELPFYRLWLDTGLGKSSSISIDASWKTPIAPVTRYFSGKMTLRTSGPIRRKNRFNYSQEEEVEEGDADRNDTTSAADFQKEVLAAEENHVALFDPENRHIVARLHAAHAFRPPSEFSMPAQGFFEARQPSQWIISEDDQLRKLVREYEYNWSLISTCMSSHSKFSSGAERRTPWECFERWVSFEGLPGDMAKHQYFRAWNSRREAAKEHLEHMYQTQAQNPTTSHLPPRRRSAEPLTVDRRKQGKYLSLFTIMSKVIKKREIAIAKQQAGTYIFSMGILLLFFTWLIKFKSCYLTTKEDKYRIYRSKTSKDAYPSRV